MGITVTSRRGFGATLPSGVRAAPYTVGYLGDPAALTVLNPGDTPPTGSWDGNALLITANNVTLSGYRVNGEIVFSGTDPTVTGCIVAPRIGASFGITLSGTGKGALTVTDTTVTGQSKIGSYQNNAISSDSGLIARRCDVSGTGDGIHTVAQPAGGNAIISQCWIHDLSFLDPEQHLDGIQEFAHATQQAFYTVEHCYVSASTAPDGTPMNAGVTAGPASSNSDPLVTGTINNNYFGGGIYHLRVNFRHQNTVVTNNNLGLLAGTESGLASLDEPSAVTTWSGNVDGNSNTVNKPGG